MDAVKFLEEKERMCYHHCTICPMRRNKVNFNILNKNECNEFIFNYPQCAVEIVEDEYVKRLTRESFQTQVNAYYGR